MLQQTAIAQGQTAAQAPRFEVDPYWPRPLPNHWLLGNAIGVWADARDQIWIVHRSSATLANNEKALELKEGDCCQGAPPILAFDRQGNLVKNWGGPGKGYDWPSSNHGIFIDHMGNVWIGGNGPGDSQIMKFTQDGKFIAQYGKPNARLTGKDAKGQNVFTPGSSDKSNFGRVAKIFVDPKANEAYIADGYFNRRVAVLDASTGAMKRFWGAYGKPPDDKIALGTTTQRRRRSRHSATGPCADLSVTAGEMCDPSIAFRSSNRTGHSCRKCSSPRTPSSRGRCGTSRSRRIRSSASSMSATA
jgi:hypothetical protein